MTWVSLQTLLLFLYFGKVYHNPRLGIKHGLGALHALIVGAFKRSAIDTKFFLPFHYLLNAFKYLQCILPLWNVCNAFHTIWKGTKLEASFLVFLMLLKLPPTTRKVLTGLQIVLTKTQDTQNRIKYSCHKN